MSGLSVIKPCAPLRPYVRYYWVLESREPFHTLTFPIGCPQIIFHKRTPLYIPELSVSQDRFTISGQVNFPAHIASAGDTEMIVAVFHPHTIGLFIDTPPSAFYNSEISGYDIENKSLSALAAQVLDCESTAQCVGFIERWLLSRLSRCPDMFNIERMGNVISLLKSNPSQSVHELAGAACLSTKQFGRVFNSHVGMMPKEYARIVRFQKALWRLQRHTRNYADIAYSCGYSDPSHFIREFRQFSGVVPSAISQPYSDLYTSPV